VVTFKKLWNNHPTVTGNENPCTTNGKPNFPDQCAIQVGVALSVCGVNTAKIPGVRHCGHHNKSDGHVLAAEELAWGLKSFPVPGVGKIQEISSTEFPEVLREKKGIIFFKDYWQRTVNGKKQNFRNRSGDHIDLWDGNRMTSPGSWAETLHAWARVHARIGGFGLHSIGFYSDLEDSKAIWFWQVIELFRLIYY